MAPRLSERQRQMLRFITENQQAGWTPSVREIGRAVGLRSSAAVHKQLDNLAEMGYINRLPGKARSIQVLRPLTQDEELASVPIVGQVSAGLPILSEENIDGYLSLVDEDLIRSGSTFFALRVNGESMIDAGILSGDYVVVRQQPTAEEGEIVVALVKNEATVKRFHRSAEHIRLQPANAAMEPIISRNVKILGKVVSIIRQI
jgi:repressor LexA